MHLVPTQCDRREWLCCRGKKSNSIGGTAICPDDGCCRRQRPSAFAMTACAPAPSRSCSAIRTVQSEAPRLEPGEVVPVVSLGGRAGAPCQHFGPGGGRNRAGYPGVSHDGLAEAAPQRDLRPLAPGRDLFRTGTV